MEHKSAGGKPWAGRFTESTDAFVESFTASVEFDRRLYRYDIQGSRAHARMLCKVGVISTAECDAILGGLDQIEHTIRPGESIWVLALRKYGVPLWLFRQYNPELDLHSVRPGMRVQIPVLADATEIG